MNIRLRGRFSAALLVASAIAVSSVTSASAEDTEYQLGHESLVNAGHDSGYSKSNPLDKNDPHWGWQLGDFYVSDFTRATKLDDGTTVFLKNVGDEVSLWYDLEEDITRLNGDENLSVAEDKNGWDQRFQVPQQNFGHGMLIVKHTDYTNDSKTTVYSDFLAAKASTTAATKIDVFEEGDYEVALDYEIKRPRIDVFGWKPTYKYSNYQVSFKFSVRNGNSMIFPFDLKTGAEMTNATATADGFRLDLAKSRYLDIDIKREVLNDGKDGLVEDTRFNKPAKDGNEYTDEGIYVITVSNRYTGQQTTKTIYVGTDDVLKAHAATGEPISAINSLLADGAEVAPDGSIISSDGSTAISEAGDHAEPADQNIDTQEITSDSSSDVGSTESKTHTDRFSTPQALIAAGGICVVVLVVLLTIGIAKRRRARRTVDLQRDGGEE